MPYLINDATEAEAIAKQLTSLSSEDKADNTVMEQTGAMKEVDLFIPLDGGYFAPELDAEKVSDILGREAPDDATVAYYYHPEINDGAEGILATVSDDEGRVLDWLVYEPGEGEAEVGGWERWRSPLELDLDPEIIEQMSHNTAHPATRYNLEYVISQSGIEDPELQELIRKSWTGNWKYTQYYAGPEGTMGIYLDDQGVPMDVTGLLAGIVPDPENPERMLYIIQVVPGQYNPKENPEAFVAVLAGGSGLAFVDFSKYYKDSEVIGAYYARMISENGGLTHAAYLFNPSVLSLLGVEAGTPFFALFSESISRPDGKEDVAFEADWVGPAFATEPPIEYQKMAGIKRFTDEWR